MRPHPAQNSVSPVKTTRDAAARARREVRDGAEGVAGDVDAAGLDVGHADDVARVDLARLGGNAPAIGDVRHDLEGELARELLVAADVVVVMVGAPDGDEANALSAHGARARGRPRRRRRSRPRPLSAMTRYA